MATSQPIRGQCAARAGLPEELRSSFLGVETFQEYSRTCWGCLEARQGPRRSAGTARRAKETRREHEEGQGDQQRGKKPAESLGLESQRVPGHLFFFLTRAGMSVQPDASLKVVTE